LLSVVSLDDFFENLNMRRYNLIGELINKSLTDVESIALPKLVLKRGGHFLGSRESGELVSESCNK